MESCTYLVAKDFLRREITSFERNIPIIIDGITEDEFSSVKEKLIANFGKVELVTSVKDGCEVGVAIGDLELAEKIVLPAVDFTKRRYFTYGDLLEIIRRLRDPDGCPWDRAQTHSSIRNCAIEEAYELVEAIDLNNIEKMTEESGDVLLQGLFNATIAEANGTFTPVDVINVLCRKLIDRHTHIFGTDKATDSEDALKYWEQAKAVEKGYSGIKEKLDSVPVTFGSLMRAYKIQKIIKKTGFDFSDVKGATEKIFEELRELDEAVTAEEREKEAGDVLFAVLNVLRFYKIDPELALNGTTERFARRFLYVEEKSKELGFELIPENIDIMEKYYQEAKKVVG